MCGTNIELSGLIGSVPVQSLRAVQRAGAEVAAAAAALAKCIGLSLGRLNSVQFS